MVQITFEDDRQPLDFLLRTSMSQTDYSYLCQIADRKGLSVNDAAALVLSLGFGVSRFIDDL